MLSKHEAINIVIEKILLSDLQSGKEIKTYFSDKEKKLYLLRDEQSQQRILKSNIKIISTRQNPLHVVRR